MNKSHFLELNKNCLWPRRLVVRTPPFQGGDRRFESDRGYQKFTANRLGGSLFCFIKTF